jgi:chromodomain-helicase-DNA-binding protein 7
VHIYRLVTKNTYESEMFARASRKLGLDHAVLTHMEHGSGVLDDDDNENIERVLRMGAYSLMQTDEESESKSKAFNEADIDTILKNNARVIKGKQPEQNRVRNLTGTDAEVFVEAQEKKGKRPMKKGKSAIASKMNVTRQSFSAATDADAAISIDDPNFWSKMMPVSDIERYNVANLAAAYSSLPGMLDAITHVALNV